MNSFFDDLLEKRHFPQCPLPLWRLKITDCEFDELHELLHRIASQFDRFDDPFVGYERECALYVAEWYRRKHTHGKPGFEIIYSSLEGRNANMGGCVKSTCPRLLTLYNDQSPDFPKPGLCYVKDFLYLCT